jgi:hypothetical protein
MCLAKDKRIRCPNCVLMDNFLSLLHRGMKLVWPESRPDIPEILEKTLKQRASLLGYKWDQKHKAYSTMDGLRYPTGSYRWREKEKKRK